MNTSGALEPTQVVHLDKGMVALDRTDGIGRLAVVGTWGVPARYGGFETLAEQLARNIDPAVVKLVIYGQKSAYSEAEREGGFAGHDRVWIPFSANGAQSVLHDALQLLHAALIGRHDQIVVLGSSGVWVLPIIKLFRPRLRVVTNIDGLEWRRDKFGPRARRLLKFLEAVAVKFSCAIIADNEALVPLVRDIHGRDAVMIAYGGDHIRLPQKQYPDPDGYLLSIARIEPENNSALILEAVRKANARILSVGNWSATEYGRELLRVYGEEAGCNLHFAVYDQDILAEIRAGSSAYVHGHSVGGTNPSLVEAIFHSNRILAFDCSFNRATLENEGAYFRTVDDLVALIRQPSSGLIAPGALQRLRERYHWSSISAQYISTAFPNADI